MGRCIYCAGTGLSMGHGTGWVPCPAGCGQPLHSSGRYSSGPARVLRTIDQLVASYESERRTRRKAGRSPAPRV